MYLPHLQSANYLDGKVNSGITPVNIHRNIMDLKKRKEEKQKQKD